MLVAKVDNERPAPAVLEDVHVLHVVCTLTREGGMEGVLRRVVVGLGARGVRHSVLLVSSEPPTLELAAPIHPVVPHRRDPRTALAILGHLEALRPTVVHVRNSGAWLDAIVARALSRPRRPLVWSFHGVDTLGALPWSRRLALRAAERVTSRVFAVSEASRRDLAALAGISPSRIEVIANGVDTEHFSPRREPRSREAFVFGTLGRLEPIKNHALLVDAFAELVARGHGVELWIGGTGSRRASLEARVAEHGIDDRVRFAGHVHDTARFLRELDAFVLTSDGEGHPNALLEALACGLPAIATSVGGVHEVLDGGRAGILVPPGARGPLVGAMTTLAASRELQRTLGERARARVVDGYGLERMLDAYEALYRDPDRTRRAERAR
ncbi:glycosyltransferase [Myxococcota bacterium]|nr:glycosyltransferase [Myxococcota bacterium]